MNTWFLMGFVSAVTFTMSVYMAAVLNVLSKRAVTECLDKRTKSISLVESLILSISFVLPVMRFLSQAHCIKFPSWPAPLLIYPPMIGNTKPHNVSSRVTLWVNRIPINHAQIIYPRNLFIILLVFIHTTNLNGKLTKFGDTDFIVNKSSGIIKCLTMPGNLKMPIIFTLNNLRIHLYNAVADNRDQVLSVWECRNQHRKYDLFMVPWKTRQIWGIW